MQRQWEALHLRQEGLLWSRTLMETAYIIPYLAALVPDRAWRPAWSTMVLLIWSVLLIHVYATRMIFASMKQFRSRGLTSAGVAVLTWFLLTKIWVYPQVPLFADYWLLSTLASVPHMTAFPPEIALFLVAFFLWWRGINIGNSNLDFRQLAYQFRLQLLFLAGGMVLLQAIDRSYTPLPIWLFFGAGTLMLALQRMEAIGQISGKTGRQFDRRWLILLSFSSSILLLFGALLRGIFSERDISAMMEWLSPLFGLIGWAIVIALEAFLRFMTPLLTWLIRTIALPATQGTPTPATPATPNFTFGESQAATGPPPWMHVLFSIFGYTTIALLILSIAFLITLTLYRRHPGGQVIAESHKDLSPDGLLGEENEVFWSKHLQRLRRLWEQLRHIRSGAQLLAAISIRNIYANVSRLAARQGHPRRPAETPYEYLSSLQAAFPESAGELSRITEAYVQVEYGRIPTGRGTLAALRRDWQNIRDAARERKKGEA